MKLQGKVALVTGATSGIGEACARAFHGEGATVVLAGRREDRLRSLAAALGVRAHTMVLDVTNRAEVAGHPLPDGISHVDVLVSSAGLALGLEPFHEASLDDMTTMIETNCVGLVHVARRFLPGMVARGSGHVVHIGSVAGTYPYPAGHVYAATKAFVHQLTLGMKADLAGTGVRVTSIEPGMVETEFSKVRFSGDDTRAAKVYEGMTPLSAADIADLVLFAVTRPPHVNVNTLEVMPVAQGFGPFVVKRG